MFIYILYDYSISERLPEMSTPYIARVSLARKKAPGSLASRYCGC